MASQHDIRFPNEPEAYRTNRNALLGQEADLRRRLEDVAAMRRGLPLGGKVPDDYVFEEGPADITADGPIRKTKLSELFAPEQDSLVVYSFMYAPGGNPCPMCTSMLDGLDGNAPHIVQRVNLAVVAKAPIDQLRRWASGRGWRHLRLLSSRRNSYNTDYHAENPDGGQLPALNVFRKSADGIFHTYNTELLYMGTEGEQDPRHVDLIWPLWNVFDLTPEGRGTGWYPSVSYAKEAAHV